jgi:hypothetical protein
MTHLKEDGNLKLEQAEELGYTAFGPVVTAFYGWLTDEAKRLGVRRLYFLAREGHFLLDLFKKYCSVGLAEEAEFDMRYLLISRRAVFGAADKSREFFKAMLNCGPFEGSLHALIEARIGLTPEACVKMALPNPHVELPEDPHSVLATLERFIQPFNELAIDEKNALQQYLRQEGFDDGEAVGLVDLGYSGSIQRWLGPLSGKPVTGFYFATTISVQEFQNNENRVRACFASDCSLTKTPPIYRYALALESWLTAPSGQLVQFMMSDGVAKPQFAPPGRMQEKFQLPTAVAKGVARYMDDCAFLARFDSNWKQSLHVMSQDVLAAAMESRIFEDVFNALSVEDAFCGHGEISIFDRIADLTSDVKLLDVITPEGDSN